MEPSPHQPGPMADPGEDQEHKHDREHDNSRATRTTAFSAVSTSLAMFSDQQLGALVDAATPIGFGIGGPTVLLDLAGTPVFVKRIALTDLERRPENVMSTANMFDLPTICQYGLGRPGGPGFGAWREVAVHTMTTNWVLSGESENFPLMYHWRVLPCGTRPLPDELADIDHVTACWEGSPEVRARLEQLERATASVLLFLEYIPQTVHGWLADRIKDGGQVAESACTMVEEGLRAGVSFMNARGLLHFDAHFENILTDGRRMFFTDFGLAMCSRFDYSAAETEFFHRNESYDRYYTVNHLVRWLTVELAGKDKADQDAFLAACAAGKVPDGAPLAAAAAVGRYAPVHAVMSEFYREFQNTTRTTPYPRARLERVCAGLSWP